MIDIKDVPGRIKKAVMRTYFERAINETPTLKANTRLGAVTLNGEFSYYTNPDTDNMWLGFALGMRCAERVAEAVSTLDALLEKSNPDVAGQQIFPDQPSLSDERSNFEAWFMQARKLRNPPERIGDKPDGGYFSDDADCCWQGWMMRALHNGAPK